MKPGLQLIDMEEDNPGGLLNHGHLEDEQESLECPPILVENEAGKDPITFLMFSSALWEENGWKRNVTRSKATLESDCPLLFILLTGTL